MFKCGIEIFNFLRFQNINFFIYSRSSVISSPSANCLRACNFSTNHDPLPSFPSSFSHIEISLYAFIYMRLSICVYLYANIFMHISKSIFLYSDINMYIFICIHLCGFLHWKEYKCIQRCEYIHVYTYMLISL